MSKATFASRTFRGNTFAAGAWRGVGTSIDTSIDPETVLAADSRPLCFVGASRPSLLAGDRDHAFVGPPRELSLSSERHDLFAGANR